jgi:Xaa-Pro aminopeptidase
MDERGLAALLLFSPHNVNYLCGMDSENWFDFQCLFVMPDRDPVLLIFDFELARWQNSSVVEDVRAYAPSEDPLEATAKVARDLGLGSGRLGVEQRGGITPSQFAELRAALPGTIEDPFGVVEDVRLVKSERELELMRRAAGLTDRAVEAGFAAVADGVPDHVVAAAITAELYGAGSDTVCWGPIVAAGYRSGSAHSSFCGHRIAAGETVFLELTGEVSRYTAPLMRTGIVGEPGDDLRTIEAAAQATLDAIQRTARDGVRACDVAAAARDALRPALELDMVFHYNFGYPVGLGYPPTWIEQLGFFLQAGNERPLATGMTFHLPMSLRRYGSFACNLSQTILVREHEAEALTKSAAALRVICR